MKWESVFFVALSTKNFCQQIYRNENRKDVIRQPQLVLTLICSLIANRWWSYWSFNDHYLVYATISCRFLVFSWLKMWKRYRMHDCSKQIYLICARFADNSQMQWHHLFNGRARMGVFSIRFSFTIIFPTMKGESQCRHFCMEYFCCCCCCCLVYFGADPFFFRVCSFCSL